MAGIAERVRSRQVAARGWGAYSRSIMTDESRSRGPERRPSAFHPTVASLSVVLRAQPRDIGSVPVRRALPALGRRHVGPFVFIDHIGPLAFPPGEGMDVGPHPHIGLATVTYLFEGVVTHRDSIGSREDIVPGDINWMSAGRGIAHSERTPEQGRGGRLHGVQAWVALPVAHEEGDPSFHHYPSGSLPRVQLGEATAVVLVGEAFGVSSPVKVASPTLYLDLCLPPDSIVKLPDDQPELSFYVVEGAIAADGEALLEGDLAMVAPGAAVELAASCASRVLVFGGAAVDAGDAGGGDGQRRMVWNFVSSSAERIERATSDWREGRFPPVFDDDGPAIPFPGDPPFTRGA